jgi:signal transduction histidine kinase
VELRRRRHEKRRLEYLNQYLRHEVLNEANKITGDAELLASNRALDEECQEWTAVIRDSGREITECIQAIRTVMTVTGAATELQPVDVTTVAVQVADQVRRTNPDATITVAGDTEAYGYAGELLDRVVTNLLENAIQHNPDGVSVAVEITTTEDAVTIAVRDDGNGIPEAVRATLFEPPTAGDHGYGLYLARHTVELYGDRLDLDRTGSDGTTFTVRLDRASPTARGVRSGGNRPETGL